jgi:hypothetical protein
LLNGEASREFETFGMAHSQTYSPTFNPRMYKVSIKGTPMFSKKGKAQESPFEGVLGWYRQEL